MRPGRSGKPDRTQAGSGRQWLATYVNVFVAAAIIALCFVSLAAFLNRRHQTSIVSVVVALGIGIIYVSQPRGASLSLSPGKRQRFAFTAVGVVFVAMTLAMGFAAMNANANLLLMLFCVLIAAILANGFVATISLARLEVAVMPPEYAVSEEPFDVVVRIRNAKRIFGALGIAVEHVGGNGGIRSVKPGFIPMLPARGELLVRYQAVAPTRGLADFASVSVATSSPFGFFRRWIEIPVDRQLLVLPRRGVVQADFMGKMLSRGVVANGRQSRLRGVDAEFRSLREFIPGDEPRHIHWRQSAKHGKLMLREFDSERQAGLEVVLDCTGPGGDGFERAVCFVATVLEELAAAGRAGRLLLCGRDKAVFSGTKHARAPSEADVALATVAPEMPAATSSRDGICDVVRARGSAAVVVTRAGPVEITEDGSLVVGRDHLQEIFDLPPTRAAGSNSAGARHVKRQGASDGEAQI